MSRILIALDTSNLAEQAIPFALGEASPGDELLLLYILEPLSASYVPAVAAWAGPGLEREEAQGYLEGWAGRLRDAGFPVTVLVEEGLAREQIPACARREQADLMVLNSHGRHGPSRWLLGSVAEAVCRLAPCPVLMVNAREARSEPELMEPQPRPERVLIPLDGTPLAETALQQLSRFRAPRPTLILMMSVDLLVGSAANMLDSPAMEQARQSVASYLEGKVRELSQEGWSVTGRIEPGVARTSILEAAEALEVDRILMATHGRTGFERWLCGSVAENVVRHSPCPVMLVKSA